MKDDTISRQAAIETVRKAQSIGQAHRMLLQLPSVQPGWIPCTPETMPKMTDVYLVKVRINEYGEGMYPTFRTALWHTASRKWFVHESENSIIGEVTAWMPIPWEGGQDEQN